MAGVAAKHVINGRVMSGGFVDACQLFPTPRPQASQRPSPHGNDASFMIIIFPLLLLFLACLLCNPSSAVRAGGVQNGVGRELSAGGWRERTEGTKDARKN